MNILVTMPLNELQRKRIEQAAPHADYRYCLPGEAAGAFLADADVILGNLADPKQVRQAPGLRWIQLNNAGTEGYCEPGILPEECLLTNATGAYGLAISEHMVGCLFMVRKKLHLYYANQIRQTWRREGHVGVIEGSTVLVVGLGDIGQAFARKMKGLGCYIIGCRRSRGIKPEYVDELYTAGELEKLLPRADVVALSMPGNEETYHTLDRERIGLLRENAIVLNVGRGSAVDTEALTESLYAGRIAGAALDVTDPEPLPPGHPLWNAPNVVITPHASGGSTLPETLDKIVEICAENLHRFVMGQPLENCVDRRLGYARKGQQAPQMSEHGGER